jgi:hypothetical protein
MVGIDGGNNRRSRAHVRMVKRQLNSPTDLALVSTIGGATGEAVDPSLYLRRPDLWSAVGSWPGYIGSSANSFRFNTMFR